MLHHELQPTMARLHFIVSQANAGVGGSQQDMAPYVPLVMPELQAALVDPLPEVRATAARAMGSLLRSMGDDLSKQVMPWLLQTLKSDVSTPFPADLCQGFHLLTGHASFAR